jgi:hypothetical protein
MIGGFYEIFANSRVEGLHSFFILVKFLAIIVLRVLDWKTTPSRGKTAD